MNKMAIGVFDSGVGGLSCVKELLECLPAEDVVYLGDTLRMPYGVKTIEQLKHFADNNVAFLQRRNVKLIAAACGTVSSNVKKEDMHSLKVPFVDVINSTVSAALSMSKTKRIGIIGTPATIRAGSFERFLKANCPSVETISVGCPEFVTLIEGGHIAPSDELTISVAREYLASIKEFGVDTLILGCTHYPIISEIIGNIMGNEVVLVDAGRQTALEIERVLKKLEAVNDSDKKGDIQYFVTAKPQSFDDVAKIFLGEDAHVKSKLIDIED